MTDIFNPFQFALNIYDAEDLLDATKELFSVRDSQISKFMAREITDRVRFGTAVFPLPPLNGSVFITYDVPFTAEYTTYALVILNGHYLANISARLEVTDPSLNTKTGFSLTHCEAIFSTAQPTGTVGNNCRVNYVSYGY